jgi:hypothetical protein
METLATLVGLLGAYTWAHFIALSFTKKWGERNTYEQVVSIMAIALFSLFVLGSM